MSHEPGLRFWLAHVESEGGLVEDLGEQAVVVLPERLRRGAGLAESLTVTSVPEVAEEDGALLLIAGHPELERAAGEVLADGDVGHLHLPWPTGQRPGREALQAQARERLTVAHGRVDGAGEPVAAYLPLLRVGAMVSYAASLNDRFHEREEVWVDALTGQAVSERLSRTLARARARRSPAVGTRALDVDLPRAVSAAHQIARRSRPRARGHAGGPEPPGARIRVGSHRRLLPRRARLHPATRGIGAPRT